MCSSLGVRGGRGEGRQRETYTKAKRRGNVNTRLLVIRRSRWTPLPNGTGQMCYLVGGHGACDVCVTCHFCLVSSVLLFLCFFVLCVCYYCSAVHMMDVFDGQRSLGFYRMTSAYLEGVHD